jgi:integrase
MSPIESKYICHTALFSTGERFPILLYRDSYQPVVLATRYIIDERRDNKKCGTILCDIRVLRWFYEWCDDRTIRVEERLRNGEMLTKAEITGFCRYLKSSRKRSIIGSIGTPDKAKESSSLILSPLTFDSYVSVAERFLLWAAYEFIPLKTPEDNVRETLRAAIKRIERSFRNARVGGHTACSRYGLTREEIESIRQVIKPGAELNPFKKATQFRNYLIFELMLATGIRRGELLKIKLNHLPLGSKTTLSIVKSPDDKEDPRRLEPQVKTRMREIPLVKQLRVALWKYVQKHRKPGTSDYLFTSMRGGVPLDQGAVNFIFDHLIESCFQHLKGRLSPHVLRHTFNELLLEEAREQDLTEEQIKELQRYLNGWSEQSVMPSIYTRRVIEEQANEIAEKYQEGLYIF